MVKILESNEELSLAVAEALMEGLRGVKWLRQDAVIDVSNPVMFTCTCCLRTTPGSLVPAHEKGCKNALLNMLRL